MGNLQMCQEIVRLTRKAAQDLVLLYCGAATYDDEGARAAQTVQFEKLGLKVISLGMEDTVEVARPKFEQSDVILVSGGNTLWAHDRYKALGIDALFREAASRDVVLCGGSAGAILFFTAGHSDSADPSTYKLENDMPRGVWEYIRCPAFDMLPGLLCPHYDKVQSNGKLRADDFAEMHARHIHERGVCIDHWAALVVDGEDYHVMSAEGEQGSMLSDGSFSRDRKGKPWIWILKEGSGERYPVEREGSLSTLLARAPTAGAEAAAAAAAVVADTRVDTIRSENPSSF